LERIAGDPAKPDASVSPDPRRVHHAALTALSQPGGTLSQGRVARWWRVVPAQGAAVGALLTSDDPFLIERPFRKGRVLLSALPFDRTWDSTLPGVLEYPVLVHEVTMHLAGTRAPERNLGVGQPLRYEPPPGEIVRLPAELVL